MVERDTSSYEMETMFVQTFFFLWRELGGKRNIGC